MVKMKCSVCGKMKVTAGKFIPCAECMAKNKSEKIGMAYLKDTSNRKNQLAYANQLKSELSPAMQNQLDELLKESGGWKD